MSGFSITVPIRNEVLIGRWLCLDALLDVALEIQGVEGDRILPLDVWTGSTVIPAGPEAHEAVQNEQAVYMGSSAYPDSPVLRKRAFARLHSNLNFRDVIPLRKGKRDVKRIDPLRELMQSVLIERTSTVCKQITWVGSGNPDATLELIKTLPGLGGKTAMGFGDFYRDNIKVETSNLEKPGIMMDDGALLRPVPLSILAGNNMVTGRQSLETVSPPYYEKSRATLAMVPKTKFADGILT